MSCLFLHTIFGGSCLLFFVLQLRMGFHSQHNPNHVAKAYFKFDMPSWYRCSEVGCLHLPLA